jgi:hypothetical protein
VPLIVLGEGDPEAILDDLPGAPARERVREGVLRGFEQLEQLVVDGDVEARELCVERLDLVAGRLRASWKAGAATRTGAAGSSR